ncbi:PDZ domain-containing protein [Nocardioides sp. zg-1308]|uniref:Trypsin-like peptidase domain-containing protein n=1 Tax=Nocardioides renjunii TaxID=3095075 RepID=A0ABU5KD83_9ACTN|nr:MULTISPECIES: trypsin-like peptidase domain-containing protein [unclassified Nocardioides]MDZ5662923.1 trypsin-like peptidase domain-containing protein [Nocardioides sp. S-58]NPD05311.1 PDZ domain-containing protein [Nocardioides sp. zg-1308]WQQ23199.1 trypsin-like peptidase domain-containing protein [Nocardioides sp. S-34]
MSSTPPPYASDDPYQPRGTEQPAPGSAYRPEQPPRRRRTGLAAAVLATSLLVGGGAGIGGAALWDATQDETSTPARDDQVSTSPVADQSQAPAADGSVESVAQKVLPSVVKIDVATAEGGASGSGIVLTADGTILTNNHVVEGAEEGGSLRVSFDDGTSADAEILGTDPLTDTAVIKASGVTDLTPATIGRSADLGVGEGVVAIGSPFGLDATVTSGIVSALDRPVNVGSDDQGNSTTYPAVQTDAAINPGNSGGPLVDMTGAVVGINSSIRTAASGSPYGEAQSGSIGLGFAIPIDEVMPIVDQMAAGETPTHARLGIQVGDAETGDEAGAVIREVSAGSTAEEAGIEAGDVITSIDGQRITGADSLVATIRSYRPGDEVEVTWTRDGESQDATVTLDSDATGG